MQRYVLNYLKKYEIFVRQCSSSKLLYNAKFAKYIFISVTVRITRVLATEASQIIN